MTHRRISRTGPARRRFAASLFGVAAAMGWHATAAPAAFDTTVRPLLAKYCTGCHSAEKHKGDLDLERFASVADVKRQPKIWQAVAEQLANREMPPKEKPQPESAERTLLLEWAETVLDEIAASRAGDPGPVVLRRLSNAEYTHTLRDLTGVDSLDPAREFPVDGAAGEGFVNTGNALVMSPALLDKYLAAGKDVAAHAVLLPDGIRFSPHASRRDWTDDLMGRIRAFYRRYTDSRGATRVNLQGLQWDTNEGGRLPLEPYLEALVAERDALATGERSVESIARERDLSPKYLGGLARLLDGGTASPLLDDLRRRWKTAKPGDVPAIVADIGRWQQALWKFSSVGHVGKVGGPKGYLEPVSPIATRQEVRLKIPAAGVGESVALQLVATDAGDGGTDDFVVWENPRLVAPGRPDLPLRDLRATAANLVALRRGPVFQGAAGCLAAVAEVEAASGNVDLEGLARKHGVEPAVLGAWLDFLGIASGGPTVVTGHFAGKLRNVAGFDFVSGWGSPETPSFMANASGKAVRIPGNLKPRGVVMHPSPTLRVAAGWQSPVEGVVRIAASVAHAHPECGNGIVWSLELRRGGSRQRLASGATQGGKVVSAGPFEGVAVRKGDLVSVVVGSRDGNHSCDLTAVDLTIRAAGDGGTEWDLAREVSPDVLGGNPHADGAGHPGVWHFYTEPDAGDAGPVLPAGSLLSKWRTTPAGVERGALAAAVQALLVSGPPKDPAHPDTVLYRQIASLGGPFFRALSARPAGATKGGVAGDTFGPDPALFGKHPAGGAVDASALCVQAPAVVEFRLPADLAEGCELVASATLHRATGSRGSAQVEARVAVAGAVPPLRPGLPVLVGEGGEPAARLGRALDEFRAWFPAALCYAKIVPVDEVVTLTLFYREDDHLKRLRLDDAGAAELDRLWEQLRYVSQDALTLVDAFAQLMEYATQDADPKVFEPLGKPIHERAAAYRKWLLETEPRHVDAVLEFADRAYRRPLRDAEKTELRALYARLRSEGLAHDDATRLMLARVLVAPAFLYKAETPVAGNAAGPVSDHELAVRLSYLLWSSIPDARLRGLAGAGRLHDPDVLVAEARRMLRDPKVRRLATEFGCAWLHLQGFEDTNEKSERHFPTFAALRGPLYEESVLLFDDFFRNNGRVGDLIGGDHVFVNEALAKHYGIPGIAGSEWRRVDGARRWSRGGILGLGAVLARESGASRTSPILRGNWLCEVLLGEKLPKPPKDVPRLPEDETATEGLTVRQLVEKHSSDPKCAGCHVRIDPYGFALEGFDAIGRHRTKDLGDRPVETSVRTLDGARFDGFEGLREYLLTRRREAFVKQYCRKFLGYALGRGVQLSDGPLLADLRERLKAGDGRVTVALEAILRSRQFREIRGREQVADDTN